MRKFTRREFELKKGATNEIICEALCKELNNKDIDFGDSIQITVSKKSDLTNVTIDYFETVYTPECKFEYDDCIHDPAYQKHYYSKDNCNCDGCKDGSWYDDEDK